MIKKNSAKVIKAKSETVEEAVVLNNNAQQSSQSLLSKVKTSPMQSTAIAAVVFLIALASLLYYFKGTFVAALVNGQPILRQTIASQLEKQYGKQALDMLITQTLIEQQAAKDGVSISQDELDAEIAKIEDQIKAEGQTLDQILLLQGMSRDDLNKQIKLSKLVEKLSSNESSASATEIAEYIEKNAETLPAELTGEKLDNYVLGLLTNQKKSQATQTWLANLKQGAKISNWME